MPSSSSLSVHVELEVFTMGRQNSLPEGLTFDDAAALVGVSKRHIQNPIVRGEGPPVIKLGHRSVVRRRSLLRWLESREEQTPR
jgi:hypothetical protein